jgi:hypothetical protein
MPIRFDSHRDAALGEPCEATDGPNFSARKIAEAVCDGWIDEVDSIARDTDLSEDTASGPGSRTKAFVKSQSARMARLKDDADRRLDGEGGDLGALVHTERASAGLVSASGDAATEMRAAAIRAQFQASSVEARLQTIHSGSAEVGRALLFAPDMGGQPLLDARSREVIEDRLLAAQNPERHAALAIRKADHARAKFSVERAKAFIGRKRI